MSLKLWNEVHILFIHEIPLSNEMGFFVSMYHECKDSTLYVSCPFHSRTWLVRRCFASAHTTTLTTPIKWSLWSTTTCVSTVESATWSAMTLVTRPSPSMRRHTSPTWPRTAQAALRVWVCAPSLTAPRENISLGGESLWVSHTHWQSENCSLTKYYFIWYLYKVLCAYRTIYNIFYNPTHRNEFFVNFWNLSE